MSGRDAFVAPIGDLDFVFLERALVGRGQLVLLPEMRPLHLVQRGTHVVDEHVCVYLQSHLAARAVETSGRNTFVAPIGDPSSPSSSPSSPSSSSSPSSPYSPSSPSSPSPSSPSPSSSACAFCLGTCV